MSRLENGRFLSFCTLLCSAHTYAISCIHEICRTCRLDLNLCLVFGSGRKKLHDLALDLVQFASQPIGNLLEVFWALKFKLDCTAVHWVAYLISKDYTLYSDGVNLRTWKKLLSVWSFFQKHDLWLYVAHEHVQCVVKHVYISKSLGAVRSRSG